jgi:DNA repair protein RadC
MQTIRVTTRRYSFQITREEAPSYPTGAEVTSPAAAITIARHLIGSEITEVIVAFFLDARHRLTGFAEIVRGTLNANRLTPRDVLTPALLANAAAVILVHNHPSGDASPSRADRVVTSAMRSACEMVGVSLLDHIVVSDGGHYSFREEEGWA